MTNYEKAEKAMRDLLDASNVMGSDNDVAMGKEDLILGVLIPLSGSELMSWVSVNLLGNAFKFSTSISIFEGLLVIWIVLLEF